MAFKNVQVKELYHSVKQGTPYCTCVYISFPYLGRYVIRSFSFKAVASSNSSDVKKEKRVVKHADSKKQTKTE